MASRERRVWSKKGILRALGTMAWKRLKRQQLSMFGATEGCVDWIEDYCLTYLEGKQNLCLCGFCPSKGPY